MPASRRLERGGALLGLLLVSAAALGILVAGVVVGERAVVSLSSPAQRSLAALENTYYGCLDAQAHSLVSSNQAVTLSPRGNVDDLLRATAAWLHVVPSSPSGQQPGDRSGGTSAGRSAAEVDPPELALVEASGPGSCHGSEVQATWHEPNGHVVTRRGTGASMPGHGALPTPTL